MFQSLFLGAVKKLGLFVVQISGLWPFSYDHETKKFKFLWYFTIIPITIMVYPLVVVFFWSKYISKRVYIDNSVMLIMSVGFVAFNAMNFIILFASQYLKFHKIKKLLLRTRELISELNNELDGSEFKYGMLLLKFTTKTVVFMILLVYSIFESMTRYTKFEDNYVTQILSALPNIIMKLHPDIFYGGLLLINFYLKQINDRISNVLTRASSLSENNDLNEQRGYQKMIKYCELSDKLDRLCLLQCSVIEISEYFFRICSFQVTLWVALGMAVFLINMFQEYVSISTSIRKNEFSLRMFMNDLLGICLVIAEIYITTSASDRVMVEVRFAHSIRWSRCHFY